MFWENLHRLIYRQYYLLGEMKTKKYLSWKAQMIETALVTSSFGKKATRDAIIRYNTTLANERHSNYILMMTYSRILQDSAVFRARNIGL